MPLDCFALTCAVEREGWKPVLVLPAGAKHIALERQAADPFVQRRAQIALHVVAPPLWLFAVKTLAGMVVECYVYVAQGASFVQQRPHQRHRSATSCH